MLPDPNNMAARRTGMGTISSQWGEDFPAGLAGRWASTASLHLELRKPQGFGSKKNHSSSTMLPRVSPLFCQPDQLPVKCKDLLSFQSQHFLRATPKPDPAALVALNHPLPSSRGTSSLCLREPSIHPTPTAPPH